MSDGAILALGSGALAGMASLYLSWRALAALGRRTRAVAMGTVTAVVALVVTHAVHSGSDAGTWRCSICCAAREELRVAGRTLWIGEPREPSESLRITARFQSWFEAEFGPCPRHEWFAVGCHAVGSGVSCAMHLDDYYRLLPLLEDRELARAAHERFRTGDVAERRGMLAHWSRELGPLASLDAQTSELARWVREWTRDVR